MALSYSSLLVTLCMISASFAVDEPMCVTNPPKDTTVPTGSIGSPCSNDQNGNECDSGLICCRNTQNHKVCENPCPDGGWVAYINPGRDVHCYKLYPSNDYRSWADAQAECDSLCLGASLVSLESEGESNWYKGQRLANGLAAGESWTAAKYNTALSAYVWTFANGSTTALTFTDWFAGSSCTQPELSEDGQCIVNLRESWNCIDFLQQWANFACSTPLTFACEFDLV